MALYVIYTENHGRINDNFFYMLKLFYKKHCLFFIVAMVNGLKYSSLEQSL